jgi:hypothetical protein
MRITTKGQVTIPQEIREEDAGRDQAFADA